MNILNTIKNNYWLIVILILGSILRFYNIDFQSIWLDEIHTMNEANPNHSILQVYNSVYNAEQMPPLYFIIINILFKIFGYTSFVLRAFSAICGIASIYSTYLLSKEFFNKNVALISAVLISINYFGIYYSQDGRPYTFLYLFTTISFLFLVKFIKTPNIKNSFLYGLFTALMIYGHFFALFILFSQVLTLLFFIILVNNKDKWNLIKLSLFSGIVIILLHIPSFKILAQISQIQSFWVEAPTKQVFTTIYNQFFGESEFLIFLTGISFVLYFVNIFKIEDKEINYQNIVKNKKTFSFILFIFWITITLITPLIRSYLYVPMIVNRYFMVLLPVVLIIVSYGFYQIKSKLLLMFILSIFILFSLTDIFIVKSYYTEPTKTQFREGSNFIIQNNKNKTKVVSSLGWYFSYFLDNDTVKYEIVNKPLESYVEEIKTDTTKLENFWYIDAHNSPYQLGEISENFLEENYIIENNIDLIDCWAKLYVKKTDELKTIDISKLNTVKISTSSEINFWIESFQVQNNEVDIHGWAYLKGQDAYSSRVKLVLIGKEEAFEFPVQMSRRIDITKSKKDGFNYDNSGFAGKLNINKLKNGEYRIGLLILNNSRKELVITDKTFIK
ncbi:glycosyltransferase family 39 protein [Flavobacterium sp.]|uniref:glycosyltransferase family 39 protein n=1 Tax=Flavobacterium sp. TaxID=239 RepID=UPI003527B4BA